MLNRIKRIIAGVINTARQHKLTACGNNSVVGKGHYMGNIHVGKNVSIGKNAWLVASRAKICIHDHVIIAPNVTIYTGAHNRQAWISY